jgi:putative FmdB family regulatory protein
MRSASKDLEASRMPFYEYECTACKFYVELLQKISDGPLKKCPSCKKSTMKRLMSAPAFRLKGEGWYETDFKSDQEDKRNLVGADEAEAKEEPKEAVKEEKTAEKPAETKPEKGKPEAKAAPKKGAKPAKPAPKPVRKPAAKKAKPAPKKAARKPAKGK